MFKHLTRSQQSLTGRLALFFTAISLFSGLLTFVVFYSALQWSEDRMGERRILLDKDTAIERFLAGEDGIIVLDKLTTAYNDMALLPEIYQRLLADKETYIGEIGDLYDPELHMVYRGQYIDKGLEKDVILLSLIDEIEFDVDELVYSGILVLAVFAILMFAFGTILYRVSKRLIEPLSDIASQLETKGGDTDAAFTINEQALSEFHILTARLNDYRTELNQALKREQAFARYASHELRTPLTIVNGANNLLFKSEPSEFQLRQLARIKHATSDMKTMVDALLALVRYEKTTEQEPFREVSEQEFEEIVAKNSMLAEDKNLAVNLSVVSSPKLQATFAVLNMVIGNLIRNASAATQEGCIDISVSKDEIVITDDGAGLGQNIDNQGHGLGLLIVDDLCKRYSWNFTLNQHENRGCIAKISFDT